MGVLVVGAGEEAQIGPTVVVGAGARVATTIAALQTPVREAPFAATESLP